MDLDIDNEKIRFEKDGQTIEYDILFTFDSEDTLKSYVGYTDHSIATNGRKNIYVSSYDPFSMKAEMENITDSKELEMIYGVLQDLDEIN